MTPAQWRKSAGHTMAKAAELVGVKGARNPSRTWMRWENGEREPPIAVVAKIEELSGGKVSAASWAALKSQSADATA